MPIFLLNLYVLLFLSLDTFTPPTYTEPLVTFSSLYKVLIRVLLPLAVEPIIKTKSPFLICKLTPASPVTPFLYTFEQFFI